MFINTEPGEGRAEPGTVGWSEKGHATSAEQFTENLQNARVVWLSNSSSGGSIFMGNP